MMAKRVSRFPLLLAALAFLTYVGAITWHNEAYKSTWRTEQSGSLLVATSYLFYGSPFGSIAAEQWNYVLKYVAFRSASQEKHADELLKFSANHNRSAKPNTIGRMTTAGVVTQFPLPVSFSFPRTITSGADGTLWFTEYEDGGKIVRITTAGVITEFATPTRNSQPLGITMGPDGALWFTEYAGNNIGRLCPSSMDSSGDCKGDKAAERAAWHEITEYAIPTSTSTPTFIAAGPDGALWFSEESSGKIGRITTAGSVSEFPLPTHAAARGIAAGPDGNLWFTDFIGNKIGRMTPSGTVVEFPIPTPNSIPWAITAGPDHALWFTERDGNKIGRITTVGDISEFPLPSNCPPTGSCGPLGIARGPDGALWFTESDILANNIGSITTAGVISEFAAPSGTFLQYITAGPDGALWFTHRYLSAPAMLKADGNTLGYSFFATASLFFFGAHTISLVLGFAILMGISVSVFLARFSDDRILTIPVLFLALTFTLLTPFAINQGSIDQSPIGGHRFFVIAGILPTLHIIFEMFDFRKEWTRQSISVLLGLQFVLLLCVIWVRTSAMYFIAAIVISAVFALWIRRHDGTSRRLLAMSSAVLLMVALAAVVAGQWMTPRAYRDARLNSEVFWHRAFIGLGAHPDWPFGNLAATIDCQQQIPEGLVPGVSDRNGHCVYWAATTSEGADRSEIYGAKYEAMLRQAFLHVVAEYPEKVLETHLLYKPLLIWETLSASTRLEVSRRTLPILIALAVQLTILIVMARLAVGERSELSGICAAFALIAVFSVAPQLFAWSSLATSSDLVCYLYVGVALLLAAALRSLPALRYARA